MQSRVAPFVPGVISDRIGTIDSQPVTLFEAHMTRTASPFLALIFLVASAASAEVVRIEVASRADLAGGRSFGLAGPYE